MNDVTKLEQLAIAQQWIDNVFVKVRDFIGEPLTDEMATALLMHFIMQLDRHRQGYDGQ